MANNEIKCPHCKKVFRVDETEFSSIVKQVRDKEFERELRERETLLKKRKRAGNRARNYANKKRTSGGCF